MWQNFEIVGTGVYLPRVRLTAEDVDRRASLPDGWTREHIGVLNRHECVDPESLPGMAVESVRAAMEEASLSWADVDLILDGSTCRYQPVPCNAAIVQSQLGAPAWGIPCLDVQSTCLGFLVALQVANSLLASGAYRHIVIVCAEAGLQGVNWKEAESALLDGRRSRRGRPPPRRATADLLLRAGNILAVPRHLRSPRRGSPPPSVPLSSDERCGLPLSHGRTASVPRRPQAPSAAGGSVAPRGRFGERRTAGRAAPSFAARVEAMRHALEFEPERFHNRVAGIGNLTAAGIPTVFHQCRQEGLIARCDRVLLLGTSAGYSQAGLIFEV